MPRKRVKAKSLRTVYEKKEIVERPHINGKDQKALIITNYIDWEIAIELHRGIIPL